MEVSKVWVNDFLHFPKLSVKGLTIYKHKKGDNQPGCPIDAAGSCSHSRAHELFAESITSNRFLSQNCATLSQALNQNCLGARNTPMGGEPGNIGLRGLFSLSTNRNSPFAQGWFVEIIK